MRDQCLHFEDAVVVESFEVVVELMRERRDKNTAAASVAVGYFTVSEGVRASWVRSRQESECWWECCSYDASIDGFGARRSHCVSEGMPEWDCAIVVSLESAVL